MASARDLLEGLVSQLANKVGPVERVIGEWQGEAAHSIPSPDPSEPRERAHSVFEELREAWGATGDPSWVDQLITGRPPDHHGLEEDYFFALFRRPGVYAYLRLRAENCSRPTYAKLVLGAVRQPKEPHTR